MALASPGRDASSPLIRTSRGLVDLAALRVGDLVVTSSGEHRPIRWIDHCTVDCTIVPGPRAMWPIRVAANAFGDGRPSADLHLSPDHLVCVSIFSEVLIPIEELVNGSTIAYAEVDTVTYWQIELDHHDLMLANDLPMESFLDLGDASAQGSDRAPAPSQNGAPARGAPCRRVIDGGAYLAVAREELVHRARALGWVPSQEVAIHGLVGKRRVTPLVENGEALFTLPGPDQDVTISTGLITPSLLGDADERRIGIAVYEMAVMSDDGAIHSIDLDAQELRAGFHDGERDEGLHYRWTRGDLVVPATLFAGLEGVLMLLVTYESSTIRNWTRPAAAISHEARRLAA